MKHSGTSELGKVIMIAVGVTLCAITAVSLIVSLLITNEVLNPENGQLVMSIFNVAVIFLMSWRTAARAAGKKLIVSAAVGISVVLLQLLFKSAFFAQCSVAWDWRLVAAICAFLPAGVFASQKKGRKR